MRGGASAGPFIEEELSSWGIPKREMLRNFGWFRFIKQAGPARWDQGAGPNDYINPGNMANRSRLPMVAAAPLKVVDPLAARGAGKAFLLAFIPTTVAVADGAARVRASGPRFEHAADEIISVPFIDIGNVADPCRIVA